MLVAVRAACLKVAVGQERTGLQTALCFMDRVRDAIMGPVLQGVLHTASIR